MIVWLASYPRSGNTLARTFIYHTLGVLSADRYMPDDLEAQRRMAAGDPSPLEIGGYYPIVPWKEFYPQATESREVVLVKTHDLPPDDQPAIHIVRDGRMTCLSYLAFHRKYHPELQRTLADIVAGADAFGSWSSHYRAWTVDPGNPARRRLVIRYEDLVVGKRGLAERIAEFVGHRGEARPWSNPFARLNALIPDFFRKGKSQWEGDPLWTPLINAQFAAIHGPLMEELGYWSKVDRAKALEAVSPEIRELCAASAQLHARLY